MGTKHQVTATAGVEFALRSPIRSAMACMLALLLLPVVAQSQDRLRNAFDLQVPLAPRPVATEGHVRLFHELHLRNFSQETLTPERVTVVDAASGRRLRSFEGGDLAQRLAPIPDMARPDSARPDATRDGSSLAIAPGRMAVLYVELTMAPDDVPSRLSHDIAYRAEDATLDTTSGAPVAVERAGDAPLGAPLRGGPWAAVFHPSWERGHRRVFYTVDGRARIPGRFAIDLVRVDADGRMADGDPDLVRNSHAYASEVLAVADATVVAVRNDYPEVDRLSRNGRHPMRDGSGNHVVLDLGDGRHAFYEHLRPGSVRVAPGQRVKRGEVIAQLGFSGTGNWPHLHFHVADGPALLGAEGLPFAFSQFRRVGAYADIATLGRAPWTASDASERRNERPADNAVLFFPDR